MFRRSLSLRGTGVSHKPGTVIFGLVASLALVWLPASAVSETRQHGSHVHGIGHLNVALEGNTVMFEMQSPAANIVGFEHEPHDEEQREALHEAEHMLHEGGKVFVFSEQAACSLQSAAVEHGIEGASGEDDEDHDSHDHELHGEHDEHHGDQPHDHESSHSEFSATYTFSCAAPKHLKSVDVQLFSLFPGFEEIHVQLLTPTQQTAVELTPDHNRISF